MEKSASSLVVKLPKTLEQKIKQELLDQGFTPNTPPPYALFSSKRAGLSCIFYASGKLMLQGKAQEIESFSLPCLIPYLDQKEEHPSSKALLPKISEGYIGVDEAGKGDFFGPLCVAALFADEALVKQMAIWGVKDSKKLSDTEICQLASKIKEKAKHVIITLLPETYNPLYAKYGNLNHMLAAGHASAIAQLQRLTGAKTALSDQFANESVLKKAVAHEKLTINLLQRTHAESDPVVAGASILARDAFLTGMDTLSTIVKQQLPKGATHVKKAAIEIAKKQGLETLNKCCKIHFKTYREIIEKL